MAELLHSNTALLVVGLVLLALLALWLVLASRRTRIALTPPEDDGPVRRNQALIDAAPAAVKLPTDPLADPVAEPVVAPTPAPTPTSGADDLALIKGLGPKLKTQLADLGVTRFAQIAAWTEADIDRIDAQMGRFQGRIRRDAWVEQAKLLAAGDMTGFTARFGNNS
jgi:predicted flap endonuclease-1-like 5' DNA nuclease